MGSFSRYQAQNFAKKAAAHRQRLYGDDPVTEGANNFLHNPSGTAFCAPFNTLLSAVEMRTHGKSLFKTGAIHVDKSLGLVISDDTLFTHLPTGDIYEVIQLGVDVVTAAETRTLIRRRES